ncbi:MAG: glycine cleavage system protein GcvH [Ignavibacteriales bacterium]|nr:glycine cleavage system protein GcvH [Ignavibacteriales bacterium]
MNFPANLQYTKEHEWIRVEGDAGWIGITDYAQGELGDVVFVELPSVGTKLQQGKTFGTIEAVKAVSDLYAPISGEVLELNKEIQSTPELVNKEPYDKGWMVKVKIANASELASLMDVESYKKLIAK